MDHSVICHQTNDIYSLGLYLIYFLFGNNDIDTLTDDLCAAERLEDSPFYDHGKLRQYVNNLCKKFNENFNETRKYTEEQVTNIANLIADCLMIDQKLMEENKDSKHFRDDQGNALRRPTIHEVHSELEQLITHKNNTDDHNAK